MIFAWWFIRWSINVGGLLSFSNVVCVPPLTFSEMCVECMCVGMPSEGLYKNVDFLSYLSGYFDSHYVG